MRTGHAPCPEGFGTFARARRRRVIPKGSGRGCKSRPARKLLRQAGGCKAAKEAGLPERLSERYRKGVGAIEALP